ncbi:uncharacterized protein LOC130787365 [Actinidia eriantha]|uniref:uncharacterized protein LOC130787365 n=1 Tax=Actinidia eriantha TaxID=165200 RepID=UPI0025837753|nr:uncharacterized protein LOC130787365 [Actinidia eriantha]
MSRPGQASSSYSTAENVKASSLTTVLYLHANFTESSFSNSGGSAGRPPQDLTEFCSGGVPKQESTTHYNLLRREATHQNHIFYQVASDSGHGVGDRSGGGDDGTQ